MGLAASQARLISLTSRQHAIEYNAQKLLNNKLQLSNQSDSVYSRYMDALDSVKLTTKQTNSDGKTSWIAGNINNLLRKDANEYTAGEVFYVQNISDGKLYIPYDIGTIFDNSTDIQDFVVTASGGAVSYTSIDANQYILDEYQDALYRGWDSLMTPTEYEEYQIVLKHDNASRLLVNNAYSLMPRTDYYGNHAQVTELNAYNFKLKIESILSSIYANDSIFGIIGYSEEEKAVMQALADFLNTNYTYDKSVPKADGSGNETKTFDYDYGEKLYLAMNELKTVASHTLKETETFDEWKTALDESILYNYSASVHKSFDNIGDAIKDIIESHLDKTTYKDGYLNAHNPILTQADVTHYERYIERKKAADNYVPKIEITSNDAQKAKYWEEIYNAITQNGWTSVTDSQAKNDTWVSNMVKSNVAILTTWDDENEMLSKTATELSANIREMTDSNYIERMEQKYEAEMAEINAKDANIDDLLNQLETERTTITTEVQGLKQIIGDNVDAHFKTFA